MRDKGSRGPGYNRINNKGMVENRRHPDIVEKRCPNCGHESAFDKPVMGEPRFKCSKCKHRYGDTSTQRKARPSKKRRLV